MKSRFSLGLLAALIAGITLFYPLLAPTPHRIDEAHFKLIEKGMSLAQVEAIFGVPSGNYDWAEGPIDPVERYFGRQKSWMSRNGWINVYFDDEERVVGTSNWVAVRLASPWDRVRRWWKSK